MTDSPTPGLTATLAAHVAGTTFSQLPPATVVAARNALLDAIGVMYAASGLAPEVVPFVSLARAASGRAEATLIGFNHKVPAPLAAMANGAMAHALDYEDAFDAAPLHPNASLMPAVLALAQTRAPVSGEELLTAIATGCDLACRIGLSLRARLEEGGWYPPPILGAMGAVAACARLLRLPPDRVRDAFALMLMQNTCPGEIRHGADSVLRAVREAFPAQAAVNAALLAEAGIRGFPQAFEGESGFFRLFARDQYDPQQLLDDLGTRWHIEQLSFKPWPSCRGTHAAIEAALQVRARLGFELSRIESIVIDGGPVQRMLAEPPARKSAPATPIDAKFSLPFTVATALVHGAVTLDSFTPAALADRQVLELARRCVFRLREDWDVSRATSGGLALRLADGSNATAEVPEPQGAPARPMATEQLVDKFVDCLGRGAEPVRPAVARILAMRILRVAELRDVSSLLAP